MNGHRWNLFSSCLSSPPDPNRLSSARPPRCPREASCSRPRSPCSTPPRNRIHGPRPRRLSIASTTHPGEPSFPLPTPHPPPPASPRERGPVRTLQGERTPDGVDQIAGLGWGLSRARHPMTLPSRARTHARWWAGPRPPASRAPPSGPGTRPHPFKLPLALPASHAAQCRDPPTVPPWARFAPCVARSSARLPRGEGPRVAHKLSSPLRWAGPAGVT